LICILNVVVLKKRAGFLMDVVVGVVDLVSKNAMVAACCKERKLEMALDVFWREPKLNDIVSWNTLILGYAQNGYEEESLRLFVCMVESGIGWNEHTFASVFECIIWFEKFEAWEGSSCLGSEK
jgi:pentatricopeptide repeat protein